MASKKQLRRRAAAEAKAHTGIPEDEGTFLDRMAADELTELDQEDN